MFSLFVSSRRKECSIIVLILDSGYIIGFLSKIRLFFFVWINILFSKETGCHCRLPFRFVSCENMIMPTFSLIWRSIIDIWRSVFQLSFTKKWTRFLKVSFITIFGQNGIHTLITFFKISSQLTLWLKGRPEPRNTNILRHWQFS